MNCFYHIMVPAVAQCKNCGKFLCRECATRYPDMICEDCAYAMQDQEHMKIVRRNLCALCVFFVMAILAFSIEYEKDIFPMWQIILGSFCLGYICAGIPFGWYALRRFRLPDDIIILNFAFLIILGFIKFCVSVYIGWFVLLLYLLKSLFYAVKRVISRT